jgi:carboxypeptidase family protein
LAAVRRLPATSHHDFTKLIAKSRATILQISPNPGTLPWNIYCSYSSGRENIRRVAIISIVLVFAFAFIVTAQETDSTDDKIANLKQQLMNIEWIDTEARIRLEELNEQLKPQNIELAVAGIGSTHPEELREYRRKVLTIERDEIRTQRELLEEDRARIKAEIAAAEYVAYLKYALPSPSPVTSPLNPTTQLMSPEEARPLTSALRGAIITKGADGHSYNIPGASLKLKAMAQLIEASSNDQGEYEFANLTAGEYTLEVSGQGFKNIIKVVVVRSGETLIENITLEVADIQESATMKS